MTVSLGVKCRGVVAIFGVDVSCAVVFFKSMKRSSCHLKPKCESFVLLIHVEVYLHTPLSESEIINTPKGTPLQLFPVEFNR